MVLSSSRWVLAICSTQLVRGEIKRIAGHHVFNLNPSNLADLHESVTWVVVSGEKQGASALSPFKQGDRRRHNVHLAVAEQDVAIAAESPGAGVPVLVSVVGIEEGSRHNHEVNDRKGVAAWGCRVPAERVVDRPSIVRWTGHLAIPIERSIAPRCSQSLYFDAFGRVYQGQIRVAVPTGIVVIDPSLAQTRLYPTLKVKLLIIASLPNYRLTSDNRSIHRPKSSRDQRRHSAILASPAIKYEDVKVLILFLQLDGRTGDDRLEQFWQGEHQPRGDLMRLVEVKIQRFKNFFEPQFIEIEKDVTGLVGKNESGKTTILKALHRLNPANGDSRQFDVTTEYPRWRLSRDRRDSVLADVVPVSASFAVDDDDRDALEEIMGVRIPDSSVVTISRTYDNQRLVTISASNESRIRAGAEAASVSADDVFALVERETVDAAVELAKARESELKEADAARAKALRVFGREVKKLAFLAPEACLEQEASDGLIARMPKFFYFSNYDRLPGQMDLEELAGKIDGGTELTPAERTVVALLAHAGEEPEDFLDEDYDSRKAELQAASADLTQRVFEYWKQNTDLEVVFDTDMPVVSQDAQGEDVRHRTLKIELRDRRHGGVETNFDTRSTGFQWFFSFFAAFSEYQESDESIIVLLDEPGMSLHGEAQKDFVRFIFDELGSSKQTLYTTHSQHLIDPGRYEKLRAVHDQATRENPDLGVRVGRVDLSADRDTVLPIESALGYTISQHLFLGSGHHLAVEGSSDFVYLQRFSEHLLVKGETGLHPSLAIIPVGGDTNMPAFVALFGRRLKVTALVDGARTSAKLERIRSAAEANGVAEDAIVVCSDLSGMPTNADIEDLFSAGDYLKLYNWAYDTPLGPDDLANTDEPILKKIESVRGEKFNHALPAHQLTAHHEEFFAEVSETTVKNFKALLEGLNATV